LRNVVNVVAPGIATDFSGGMVRDNPDLRPFRRVGAANGVLRRVAGVVPNARLKEARPGRTGSFIISVTVDEFTEALHLKLISRGPAQDQALDPQLLCRDGLWCPDGGDHGEISQRRAVVVKAEGGLLCWH
jgi:hypothetical protein